MIKQPSIHASTLQGRQSETEAYLKTTANEIRQTFLDMQEDIKTLKEEIENLKTTIEEADNGDDD